MSAAIAVFCSAKGTHHAFCLVALPTISPAYILRPLRSPPEKDSKVRENGVITKLQHAERVHSSVTAMYLLKQGSLVADPHQIRVCCGYNSLNIYTAINTVPAQPRGHMP